MAIRRRQLINAAGAAALVALAPLARAQTPPQTPRVEHLRVLVGFPPGGPTDANARLVAERLRGSHARTVVVENRAGAAGRLAVDELRRSPADGSTLLLAPSSSIVLHPHVLRPLSDRPVEVAPVSLATRFEQGLAVGPAVPVAVRDLRSYLDWARAHPAQASYGSAGNGTATHFMGALLAHDSGVELRHVPFRGTAPGLQDLLGGHVPAFSSPVGDFLPHLREGRLRLLATSGPVRSRFAPEVPTFAEQGFAGIVILGWFGFFMPAGTAAAVTDAAAQAIRQALGQAGVVEALAQQGLTVAPSTPAELAATVRDEHAAWGRIVARVGFTPES
jgi:tripartite-type tricarboxylate transporter receptor subunit TctC